MSPMMVATTKHNVMNYSNDLNRRTSISSGRNPGGTGRSRMSYRPETYIIDDDNKWDTPLQFSQSQKNSNTNVNGRNWILPSKGQSVLSRAKINIKQQSFDQIIPDNRWINAQPSSRPSRNQDPQQVFVSRLI